MQHVTECHVEPIEGDAAAAELDEAVQHTLALSGLGCPNCANRVRNALLRTDGVLEAEIDLNAALGRVWCRPGSPPDETELVKAVVGASRGTHHRYLAVPLRRRFSGNGAGMGPSPNGRR
jgi:copper chaperone CopZ